MSDVYLYIYDLTKGMARRFSPMFLGKQIDGVWHTGIVAYDTEWYFGNDGISSCPPVSENLFSNYLILRSLNFFLYFL